MCAVALFFYNKSHDIKYSTNGVSLLSGFPHLFSWYVTDWEKVSVLYDLFPCHISSENTHNQEHIINHLIKKFALKIMQKFSLKCYEILAFLIIVPGTQVISMVQN